MNNERKNQLLYQKTDFNAHLICQLPSIIKCCKCKRNNFVMQPNFQLCLFCGTPNYIKNVYKLND